MTGTSQHDFLLDFDTRIIIPIGENSFLFVCGAVENYANRLELFPVRLEAADAENNNLKLFPIDFRP